MIHDYASYSEETAFPDAALPCHCDRRAQKAMGANFGMM